jgi:hypothetical protein
VRFLLVVFSPVFLFWYRLSSQLACPVTHLAADEVAVDASLFEDLDLEDLDEDGAAAAAAAPSKSIFLDEHFSDED